MIHRTAATSRRAVHRSTRERASLRECVRWQKIPWTFHRTEIRRHFWAFGGDFTLAKSPCRREGNRRMTQPGERGRAVMDGLGFGAGANRRTERPIEPSMLSSAEQISITASPGRTFEADWAFVFSAGAQLAAERRRNAKQRGPAAFGQRFHAGEPQRARRQRAASIK